MKMKLVVPIVSSEECQKQVSKYTRISANQVCAGGVQGRDACEGDSGGPLMRLYGDGVNQWYQEGIVSRGRGCGRKGVYGIYTRVTRYINWILNNISDEVDDEK